MSVRILRRLYDGPRAVHALYRLADAEEAGEDPAMVSGQPRMVGGRLDHLVARGGSGRRDLCAVSRHSPSRRTVAVGVTGIRSLSAAFCKRRACVKLSTILRSARTAMIAAPSRSPSAAITRLEASRMMTSGLRKNAMNGQTPEGGGPMRAHSDRPPPIGAPHHWSSVHL